MKVIIITECPGKNDGEAISREANIYVEARQKGGVNEGESDYDGDGRLNQFDHDDEDPYVMDDPAAN